MKALIKNPGQEPTVQEIPVPEGNVIVRVLTVGICRTDSRVANGGIPIPHAVVLGHEFSGVVGNKRVAVDPLINGQFMGLDIDGAMAEYVSVPASHIYELPDHVSDEAGAYLEPVAASAAVMKAPITREMRGAIYGTGRIAELTKLILETEGFTIVPMDGGGCDYIVETGLPDLTPAVKALVPGGTLIIKSRGKVATLPLGDIVAKEIKAVGVAYAPYKQAMDWISRNHERMLPFIGPSFPLERHAEAFSFAEGTETVKTFVRVS